MRSRPSLGTQGGRWNTAVGGDAPQWSLVLKLVMIIELIIIIIIRIMVIIITLIIRNNNNSIYIRNTWCTITLKQSVNSVHKTERKESTSSVIKKCYILYVISNKMCK